MKINCILKLPNENEKKNINYPSSDLKRYKCGMLFESNQTDAIFVIVLPHLPLKQNAIHYSVHPSCLCSFLFLSKEMW